MKKIVTVAIASITLVLLLGIAMAYQGNPLIQGPNYSIDRHEAMENAFNALDYTSWLSLMTGNGNNPKVVQVVNADNFATFAKAHEAMESGDLTTANELRAELGLNNGTGTQLTE